MTSTSAETRSGLRFVWLEITGTCQLACVHCYAESGPTGTHGTMTGADWRRVIDQAAALDVRMIQFIGASRHCTLSYPDSWTTPSSNTSTLKCSLTWRT